MFYSKQKGLSLLKNYRLHLFDTKKTYLFDMKTKYWILLFLISNSFYAWCQENNTYLPTEIRSNNFILKFAYDNQNRIVWKYFKDSKRVENDSIVYTPSGCNVYTLDEDVQKFDYRYGKSRKTGRTLREMSKNDFTFDYKIDSKGKILLTEGRLFDSYYGENYVIYEYRDDENLDRIRLYPETNKEEFIEALGDWERQIFDEKINYDEWTGIFSQLNPESKWLLRGSFDEFYPILHLTNNPTAIYESKSLENVVRNFDNDPATEVFYNYEYNRYGYPQKMQIKINDSQGRDFTILYRKAEKIIPKVITKQVVSDKKLLPIVMENSDRRFEFTYDDLNRFTSIKSIDRNEIVRYDSIIYGVNSYKIIDKLMNKTRFDQNYNIVDNKLISSDLDEEKTEVTFTPTGRVDQFVIETSDYPMIIGYVYDENDNLIDMDLPNNASGDRVNRTLQMIEYDKFTYDDKNGIFKYVNKKDCYFILYDLGGIFPYYYFMGNNFLGRENEFGKDDEDSEYEDDEDSEETIAYKYNEYDYPSEMSNVQIKYIEAK